MVPRLVPLDAQDPRRGVPGCTKSPENLYLCLKPPKMVGKVSKNFFSKIRKKIFGGFFDPPIVRSKAPSSPPHNPPNWTKCLFWGVSTDRWVPFWVLRHLKPLGWLTLAINVIKPKIKVKKGVNSAKKGDFWPKKRQISNFAISVRANFNFFGFFVLKLIIRLQSTHSVLETILLGTFFKVQYPHF